MNKETQVIRNRIRAALTDAYLEQFGKPLPAVLTSTEIAALGIRPRTSLDKDSCSGTGLAPLPGTGGRGKPRKYLLTDAIDALAGDSVQSHVAQ